MAPPLVGVALLHRQVASTWLCNDTGSLRGLLFKTAGDRVLVAKKARKGQAA